MKTNIILLIVFMSLLHSNLISTNLGVCDLLIYDKSIKNTDKLIKVINNTIDQMITKYGEVDSTKFAIYIVDSIDD